MKKNKIKLLISLLSLLLSVASYAIVEDDLLRTENLTFVEKTSYGNDGLKIYEDTDGIRWVLRKKTADYNYKELIDPYLTSKVLKLLLKGDSVNTTAEIRLLDDYSGTASKWLDGFLPLNDFYKDWGQQEIVHPKEIFGKPVLNREKLILATDFTGTGDRNGGNLGVVNFDDQYYAAQVDYNETFNFYNFYNFKCTLDAIHTGSLDAFEVLIEIYQILSIPDEAFENLVEETKKHFLNNREALDYLDKLKKDLINQKTILKNLKKELTLFYLINSNIKFDEFIDVINTEFNQVVPEKLLNKPLFEIVIESGNSHILKELRKESDISPLNMAARRGDLKAVKNLINSDYSVDTLDIQGHTPLFDALKKHHFEVAEYLISQGANVNLEMMVDLLNSAISFKDQKLITFMLDKMPILNSPYTLSKVIHSGLIEIAKTIIKKLDQVIPGNLIAAIKKENIELAEMLLDRGVSVNSVIDRYGDGYFYDTPLTVACDINSIEMVKLLIDRGADVNYSDSSYKYFKLPLNIVSDNFATSLMSSSEDKARKSKEILKLLLKKGANASINKKDFGGNTPLHMAVKRSDYSRGCEGEEEQIKYVTLLIENGADLLIKNNEGKNVIDSVKRSCHKLKKFLEDEMSKKQSNIKLEL